MSRGRHSAADGSFGRSAGAAAGRGAILLGIAVVLGFVLLQAADDPPPGQGVTAAGNDAAATTTTSAAEAATTTVASRAPAEVVVLVANGSGVPKVAAKASDELKPVGYNVLAPVDGNPTEASAVYFAATYQREAEAIAEKLGLAKDIVKEMPTPPPVADLRSAHVLVHVGPELAERLGGST